MNKDNLNALKRTIENLETANEQLMDMIHLLNITENERELLENLVIITQDKIDQIKTTRISELDQHVDFQEMNPMY